MRSNATTSFIVENSNSRVIQPRYTFRQDLCSVGSISRLHPCFFFCSSRSEQKPVKKRKKETREMNHHRATLLLLFVVTVFVTTRTHTSTRMYNQIQTCGLSRAATAASRASRRIPWARIQHRSYHTPTSHPVVSL